MAAGTSALIREQTISMIAEEQIESKMYSASSAAKVRPLITRCDEFFV
jgi:hypothetical protein